MVAQSVVLDRAPSSGRGSNSMFEWAGLEIEIGVAPDAIATDWQVLEASGTASVFQSWRTVSLWTAHAASPRGEKPIIVTGRQAGVLRLVLPLSCARRGGATVLQWLGQSHFNYGMGLIAPDLIDRLDPGACDELLIRIARSVGADAVHLDRQPTHWAGRINPFAASPCARLTANDTFVVPLERDYAAQYKRLFPKRTLQPIKRRQRRLEEMGPISYAPPQDRESRRKAFTWFVARKRAQLAETSRHSPFDEPGIAAFYEALLEEAGHFEIEQILVGTQRAALGMTLYGGDIAYGINTAHADAFSRGSPGTLLQHHIIARVHAKGARAYDLGPGYLPYKMDWAPDVIPLVATAHAVRLAGLPMQIRTVATTLLKARIKRSPRLARLSRSIGRLLQRRQDD
jgi:CelD/BcsL family acetyltransferase involved in cellulose biosynthesis